MSQIVRLRITRPHNQTSRLKHRLNAFACADGNDRAQVNGLTAVLKCVDATILPRALTVATETGDTLRLLVSNRRLMRVERDGEMTQDGDAPADPAEAAARFAERLEPVLRKAGQVTIGTARYTTDALFWDVGCGAGRLAALMGVILHNDIDAPAAVDPELLLSEHALARVELSASGRVLSRSSTTRAEPLLEVLLQHVLRDGAGDAVLAGQREDCSCIPLTPKYDAIVIHRRDGQTLAVTPSAIRDHLLSGWQKHSANPAGWGSGTRH